MPPKLKICGRKFTAVFTANSHAAHLPPRLLDHLLDRVAHRNISADQLGLLADRLSTEPEVPRGRWFKRFPGMAVCGEGEFIRTFLRPGQIATGEELN